MRAGSLRHEITVEKNTKAEDSKGVYVNAWTTRTTLRAEIEYISSSLEEGSRQVTSATFHTRYDSAVIREDRISFDGKYYEIVSILPDGRKREMSIEGREVS